MKLRTCDWLLLHQETGTNFNFTADSERIDALIAHGLHGVRSNHLPVIIFRAAVDCLNWFSRSGKAEQIESAIPVQVRRVEHQRRTGGMVHQHKLAIVVAEPNECTTCVSAPHG